MIRRKSVIVSTSTVNFDRDLFNDETLENIQHIKPPSHHPPNKLTLQALTIDDYPEIECRTFFQAQHCFTVLYFREKNLKL